MLQGSYGYLNLKTCVFLTETLCNYWNEFFDGLYSVLTNQRLIRDSHLFSNTAGVRG